MAKCIYVDPPYNTGKDDFIYKDNYQHSCWLSFIIDRMTLCHRLLGEHGALFCSIDDNEAQHLESICNDVFGREQLLAPLFIQVRYANKTLSEDNDFHRTIERVFFYAKDRSAFKPVKDLVEYPLENFQWKITEKTEGTSFTVAGRKCFVFKPGEYELAKDEASLEGLKETWATGSLLRQKGSSGEFFGTHLAPRKQIDGLRCLYKVEGIGEDGLGYRYFILSYMLDVESRGSPSLLNVEAFRSPDQYMLKVERDGETQLVNVDLMETFNWLLGLRVQHINMPHRFDAEFKRSEERATEGQLVLDGRLGPSEDGTYWFRTIEGTSPDGDKVLVVWRNLTDNPEEHNLVLDEWFRKQEYSTRDLEFDLIYVNGDNNLENLRREDETWKVRLIEEDFQRLMFDVQDV